MPSLWQGLFADDYFHRAILLRLDGWKDAQPVRDLFAFFPLDASQSPLDRGLAWWSDPEGVHAHFARPLTALTHVLDYALWPDGTALQHLHGLLWFGLGVALVAGLYRSVHFSARVAGLAALFYAVEDAHYLAASWLSNRNAALAVVCGAAMLHQHLAWRRSAATRHLVFALVLFVLGLGCAEAMLGAAAYVVAWQLCCEDGPLARRLIPVAPYAVVVVVWRLAYTALGYGTHGISLYIDPGNQPVAFLRALAERIPLFLGAQLLQLPIDLWLALSRPAQIGFSVLSALLVAGFAFRLRGLLARDRVSRFWALGMTLSLVPICATIPQDRLLVFAGIGAFGLLAAFLEDCRVWPFPAGERTGGRSLALLLLVLHGPASALLLPLRIAAVPWAGAFMTAGATHLPRGPEVPRQTFVFVTGSDFLAAYAQIIRTCWADAPNPGRMAVLAPLTSTNAVRRIDAHTLSITPRAGFLNTPFDRAFVRPGRIFRIGERIERPDYVAEIRSLTDDGRPLEVAFRFRVPLEDPSLSLLSYRALRPVAFSPPPTGESVTVRPGF
ncbi:MAG: hypothetical protein JNK60_11440 [Acidobacteria bacterium]|nr:hypothetical protein [Acidobacteriota bacterium]